MTATSTDALFTRIGEIIVSGSGVSPYTIPAGTFSLDWFWNGRDQETLAPHTLTKPQVNFELVRMADTRAWPKPSNQSMYSLEMELNFCYFTDSKLLRNVRDDLSKQIGNHIHLISKALQHPGNLSTTDAGAETGLAGGLLQMQDEPIAFEFDPDSSTVTGQLIFTGFLVLSSST